MKLSHPPEVEQLIRRMDRAVGSDSGSIPDVTARVKDGLIEFCRQGTELPEGLRDGAAGHYARRLLHRSDELGYTMVVMTWGPGQKTDLHDHAGVWCVECVLDGQLDVTQYDLVEQAGERYRFEPRKQVRANVGNAGCLIPPFDYHVLGNALPDRNTVTLHVYGGEMESCNLYHPDSTGWWHRTSKMLTYDA